MLNRVSIKWAQSSAPGILKIKVHRFFLFSKENSVQVFVVGPKSVLMVSNVFEAVDIAFRLFYVLNLKYPEATSIVWSIMSLFKIMGGTVPTQVDAFVRQLNNVEVDKEN